MWFIGWMAMFRIIFRGEMKRTNMPQVPLLNTFSSICQIRCELRGCILSKEYHHRRPDLWLVAFWFTLLKWYMNKFILANSGFYRWRYQHIRVVGTWRSTWEEQGFVAWYILFSVVSVAVGALTYRPNGFWCENVKFTYIFRKICTLSLSLGFGDFLRLRNNIDTGFAHGIQCQKDRFNGHFYSSIGSGFGHVIQH